MYAAERENCLFSQMHLARDSGVELTSGLFNALLQSYARASDAPGALAAFERWSLAPLQPNRGTLLLLLETCARDRRADLTPRVCQIAQRYRLRFDRLLRNREMIAHVRNSYIYMYMYAYI